jgi:sulfide dehydrogenase cytochrome subunit
MLPHLTTIAKYIGVSMDGSKTILGGLWVSLFFSLMIIHPLLASEITYATMLSISCTGCHSTDGESPGAIPTIGGKSSDFIATALREFSTGQRAGTIMGRHATAYTDEEIRLIADYFANL